MSEIDPQLLTPSMAACDVASADDSQLLLRIAMQDRAAFAELFGRFAGRVKSFLLRYAMPDEQAEEVAQEVMVQVWRKAASFDPARAGASTWIFAIARNRRIDVIRSTMRRDFDRLDPYFQPEPEADASAVLGQTQRAQIIHDALAELPPVQRDVLHATFFDGLSQAEIAQRDGLALGTVKSRVRLAFARLRERLGEQMLGELRDD